MAIGPIQDATFLVGGVDLAPFSNSFSLDVDVEALDKTNFASGGWKEFTGGLKGASWTFQGFLDPTAVEPRSILFNPSSADPGVVFAGAHESIPIMAAITRPVADGHVAFMMRALRSKVTKGAAVGQLANYSLATVGDSPMLRGNVLGALSAVAASAETAGFEIGAVSATQRLYASLHVTAVDADTLDVEIESDVDDTFGSPTTRVTFAQVDGSTVTHASEYKTAAGPITDTFFRVKYTLGAAGPFSFTVFMAIAT